MLTMILAISCTLIGVNAQSEEKIEMFSYSINTTGPVWLEYNCQQTACQGMELIVNNSGLIHKNSDPHTVEWEGMVEGNISWQLLVEEDIRYIKMIVDYIKVSLLNFAYFGRVSEREK